MKRSHFVEDTYYYLKTHDLFGYFNVSDSAIMSLAQHITVGLEAEGILPFAFDPSWTPEDEGDVLVVSIDQWEALKALEDVEDEKS